jgi:hypothetical protein
MYTKTFPTDFRLSVMYTYDKHIQLPIHTQNFYCKCYHAHRLNVMKAHKQTHLYFCSSYLTLKQSNIPVHLYTRRYAFNRHCQWIIKHYTISTNRPCTDIFDTFRPTITNLDSVQQLMIILFNAQQDLTYINTKGGVCSVCLSQKMLSKCKFNTEQFEQ